MSKISKWKPIVASAVASIVMPALAAPVFIALHGGP
jgi:hypothetical protein